MDIAYPMAADMPDLDSLIDHKIDQLIKKDFTLNKSSVGQIVVLFLHKSPSKTKKKSGWFGHVRDDESEEAAAWETWILNVNCLPMSTEVVFGDISLNSAERLLQLSLLSFEDNLLQIMDLVDKHKDHIPPIMTLDVSPFPYKIEIDPGVETKQPPSPNDESWGRYIKKMLD